MHYVMTRHLCLTRQTIVNLGSTKLVPQNVPWVTPRVLNRQIKAVIDEMLMREMQLLFENFSKSLKPKSRKEWAPCLAAFLVLTLFMESVETAADNFVISQNEMNLRNHYQPKWKRSFALDINKEVENLPFKQFAYQFHQIYQTHSKDASAKSFNPLLDDTCFEQGELDRYAIEMVLQLRKFIVEPSNCKFREILPFVSEPPKTNHFTQGASWTSCARTQSSRTRKITRTPATYHITTPVDFLPSFYSHSATSLTFSGLPKLVFAIQGIVSTPLRAEIGVAVLSIGVSWVGKGPEPVFVTKVLGKVHLAWHDMKDTHRVYSGPNDIYRLVVTERRISLDYLLRPSRPEESATMY